MSPWPILRKCCSGKRNPKTQQKMSAPNDAVWGGGVSGEGLARIWAVSHTGVVWTDSRSSRFPGDTPLAPRRTHIPQTT